MHTIHTMHTILTITGDNIATASAIARRCGILTETGIAVEGPDFRKMTPAEVLYSTITLYYSILLYSTITL